jgi:hypothetical protein
MASKDSHEQFLAENPVNFLMKATTISFKVKCPSGNTFWMFRGQKKLVKDSRDIKYMRENPQIFDEVAESVEEKKPKKKEGK